MCASRGLLQGYSLALLFENHKVLLDKKGFIPKLFVDKQKSFFLFVMPNRRARALT